MLFNPADLVDVGLQSLAPAERSLVSRTFLDGESIQPLARQHGLKQKDVRRRIQAALQSMKVALRSRGVRTMLDVC